MELWQKLLLKTISGIIIFFVVYLLVSTLLFNDFATSLEPGWHTTIIPFGGFLNLTIILLIVTVLICLFYKSVLRVVTYFWVKIFPRTPSK